MRREWRLWAAALWLAAGCLPWDRNADMERYYADKCRGQFFLARSAADSMRVVRESFNQNCGVVIAADLRAAAKEKKP